MDGVKFNVHANRTMNSQVPEKCGESAVIPKQHNGLCRIYCFNDRRFSRACPNRVFRRELCARNPKEIDMLLNTGSALRGPVSLRKNSMNRKLWLATATVLVASFCSRAGAQGPGGPEQADSAAAGETKPT